jgi:hypothetical protein
MHLPGWTDLPEREAPLLVAALSALGAALCAYTQRPVSQAVPFRYVRLR